MATPQIVQRQLEQAEATLAQSLQPVQQDPNAVTDVSQLSQPEQRPEPVAQAAPPTPTPPTENWEQRFKTLQGMFNAEVPQLRAREKTLESELTLLKAQVGALTEAKKAEPAKPQVDPKDVESFGADMIEMVQRYAQQAYSAIGQELTSKLNQYEGRVAALERTVTGVAKQAESSLDAQFYAALTSMVPDWRTVNADKEFLEWLGEIDDVYGLPRQAALESAHQRQDAERVAAVFKKFKSTRPAKPSSALAKQIAPNSGASAEPPTATAAKRTITQKVVTQFYMDQAKGRYSGREAEAKRIEAEINQAAAEGRIV